MWLTKQVHLLLRRSPQKRPVAKAHPVGSFQHRQRRSNGKCVVNCYQKSKLIVFNTLTMWFSHVNFCFEFLLNLPHFQLPGILFSVFPSASVFWKCYWWCDCVHASCVSGKFWPSEWWVGQMGHVGHSNKKQILNLYIHPWKNQKKSCKPIIQNTI